MNMTIGTQINGNSLRHSHHCSREEAKIVVGGDGVDPELSHGGKKAFEENVIANFLTVSSTWIDNDGSNTLEDDSDHTRGEEKVVGRKKLGGARRHQATNCHG